MSTDTPAFVPPARAGTPTETPTKRGPVCPGPCCIYGDEIIRLEKKLSAAQEALTDLLFPSPVENPTTDRECAKNILAEFVHTHPPADFMEDHVTNHVAAHVTALRKEMAFTNMLRASEKQAKVERGDQLCDCEEKLSALTSANAALAGECRELREALTALVKAEEASMDAFESKEIDSLEAALDYANELLALPPTDGAHAGEK